MLRRLLLQWFWDTYDALGRLAVLNLLLFTLFLVMASLLVMPGLSTLEGLAAANPPLAAMAALSGWTVIGALVFTVWFPGLLYFAGNVSQEKEFRLKDFFTGLRQSGWRFLKFALLACLVLGLIAVNAVFYARSEIFGGSLKPVGAVLAGLCFWAGLLSVGIAVNTMPWIARENRPIRSALKLGAFVTLRYPFYTFSALGFLAILWLLSAILLKTAPLWIIGLAATGTYINSMHDVVLWWEERKEAEKKKAEEAAATADAKPMSWKQILQDEEAENEPKDRYQRTLRDILKPWE